MADVFCNNCGHRNPLGSNFCSSCGAVLETQAAENTTITFHPTAPTDPIDEEVSVELDEVPEEIKLFGRQTNLFIPRTNLACFKIDFEIAGRKCFGSC